MYPVRSPRLPAGVCAALLLLTAAASPAASPVGPAPILEQPLAPALNDQPGEAPSPQHAWVPGHWRWLEGSYVWEAGRWELPPITNAVWHAPEWIRQTNGFVLREGFWQESDPSAPAAQEIVATQPPPPPPREVMLERPTPAHVWIGGYWGWEHGRHAWIGGRWELAPRSNVVWVAPRWELRAGRYVFIRGYWRNAAAVTVPAAAPGTTIVVAPPAGDLTVVVAPPPPRHEVVYARPSPHHIWISGYWAWRGGRHVWVAGHYETPPRGYRTWSEPRWERRGGSYLFIEGRWGR